MGRNMKKSMIFSGVGRNTKGNINKNIIMIIIIEELKYDEFKYLTL